MNRFLCLLLLTVYGLPTLADPLTPNNPIEDLNAAQPKPGETQVSEKRNSAKSQKTHVNIKLIKKANKAGATIVPPLTKLKNHDPDPKTIGDFGPLPTNSFKKNKTVHPDDFQTVPVESGGDNRKAK